ncbi:MAG TPA: hypothetical protein VFF06_34510 [Polyangia bacterium]|nr:hypothetical protein [Polyangia bacterium]
MSDDGAQDPERHRFDRRMKVWEVSLKSLSGALAIFGLGIAIHKGVQAEERRAAEQEASRRQQVLEFDLKERDKLSDACAKAIGAAATIARASDRETARPEIGVFWKLYGGEMCLYEGAKVNRAMADFGVELDHWKNGAPPEVLMVQALDLSRSCRAELAEMRDQAYRAAITRR